MEETPMYDSQHTAKFEFSFPISLCLPFYELYFSVKYGSTYITSKDLLHRQFVKGTQASFSNTLVSNAF